jgi:hypothetical protein
MRPLPFQDQGKRKAAATNSIERSAIAASALGKLGRSSAATLQRLTARNGCATGYRLRLLVGVWQGYEDQDDADYREVAEGGFLAVPRFRLPHQEPLSAYRQESY